jgi:probable HAF family extracellular repeat protein
MLARVLAAVSVIGSALIAGPASAQATFTPLVVPDAIATGISGNGKIVVGSFNGVGGIWRWTALGGLIPIGGFGGVVSISRDGSTITGDAQSDPDGPITASVWLGNDAYYSLGGVPEGGQIDAWLSNNYSVSGDGFIVVGLAWLKTGKAHAFRWEQSTGMVDLGAMNGRSSRANAISADGTTIVGWDEHTTGFRLGAFWRDGKETVIDAPSFTGEAGAVTRDGNAIAGSHYMGGPHAYLWTAGGATDIGILDRRGPNSDFDAAHALAVSDDAKVVVGTSGFGGDSDAFIWTPDTGMVKLEDHLKAKGATGLTGWLLSAATAISSDGKIIAGWGVGPRRAFESWVATLP